jgi:hypothetical protein
MARVAEAAALRAGPRFGNSVENRAADPPSVQIRSDAEAPIRNGQLAFSQPLSRAHPPLLLRTRGSSSGLAAKCGSRGSSIPVVWRSTCETLGTKAKAAVLRRLRSYGLGCDGALPSWSCPRLPWARGRPWVVGSWRADVIAMTCRGWLSWRSPPRCEAAVASANRAWQPSGGLGTCRPVMLVGRMRPALRPGGC